MQVSWNKEKWFLSVEGRDKNITKSWLNRNSLHVDTSWNISKNKSIVQIIIDWFNWVLDDDIFQKHFKTDKDAEIAISRFFENMSEDQKSKIREENIELLVSNLKRTLPYVDAVNHFDLYSEAWVRIQNEINPYCNIWYWISSFNFVKLEDKELYIRDFSKYILNSISFYINQINCNREFLSLYMEFWYISEQQVKEKIREVLISKWREIYNNLTSNKGYTNYVDHIPEYQKYILAFCFINWTITKEMSLEMNFDHWETLEYYVLNYWKVNLINIYFNKLFNNLSPEETEKYFRF